VKFVEFSMKLYMDVVFWCRQSHFKHLFENESAVKKSFCSETVRIENLVGKCQKFWQHHILLKKNWINYKQFLLWKEEKVRVDFVCTSLFLQKKEPLLLFYSCQLWVSGSLSLSLFFLLTFCMQPLQILWSLWVFGFCEEIQPDLWNW